jgi:hypothetical protein
LKGALAILHSAAMHVTCVSPQALVISQPSAAFQRFQSCSEVSKYLCENATYPKISHLASVKSCYMFSKHIICYFADTISTDVHLLHVRTNLYCRKVCRNTYATLQRIKNVSPYFSLIFTVSINVSHKGYRSYIRYTYIYRWGTRNACQ